MMLVIWPPKVLIGQWLWHFSLLYISVGNHVTQSMYGLHHVNSVICFYHTSLWNCLKIVTTTRYLMSSRVGESSRIKIMYTVHTSSEIIIMFFV